MLHSRIGAFSAALELWQQGGFWVPWFMAVPAWLSVCRSFRLWPGGSCVAGLDEKKSAFFQRRAQNQHAVALYYCMSKSILSTCAVILVSVLAFLVPRAEARVHVSITTGIPCVHYPCPPPPCCRPCPLPPIMLPGHHHCHPRHHHVRHRCAIPPRHVHRPAPRHRHPIPQGKRPAHAHRQGLHRR